MIIFASSKHVFFVSIWWKHKFGVYPKSIIIPGKSNTGTSSKSFIVYHRFIYPILSWQRIGYLWQCRSGGREPGKISGSAEKIKSLVRQGTKMKQRSFIFIQQAFANCQGLAQFIITVYSVWLGIIVTCHLMTVLCSEKCVVGWFRYCVNITECNYTNLEVVAQCKPGLNGRAYCT